MPRLFKKRINGSINKNEICELYLRNTKMMFVGGSDTSSFKKDDCYLINRTILKSLVYLNVTGVYLELSNSTVYKYGIL